MQSHGLLAALNVKYTIRKMSDLFGARDINGVTDKRTHINSPLSRRTIHHKHDTNTGYR